MITRSNLSNVSAAVFILITGAATTACNSAYDESSSYGLAVAAYADEYGLSIEKATDELETHIRLAEFGESARNKVDGFAGFKIEREETGPVGVLATTQSYSEALVPHQLDIRLKSARFTAMGIKEFWSQRQVELRTIEDSIKTLTYDPFADKILVWRMPNGKENRDATHLKTQKFMSENDVGEYEYRTVEVVEPVMGGLMTQRDRTLLPDDKCTTGFGVEIVNNGVAHSGYITAGHCWLSAMGNWKVETPNGRVDVSTAWDVNLGGYQDSVVMEAPGAAAEVHFTNGIPLVEPVSANPIRPFPGLFLCRYGKRSDNLRCGFLDSVNVVVQIPLGGDWYTMFYDATNPDGSVSCSSGDSGGPVWLPGNWDVGGVNRPAGLISATDFNNNRRCLYVPITDNLGNWNLIP